MDKIVRSICYFERRPNNAIVAHLEQRAKILSEKGFTIQTKRICVLFVSPSRLENAVNNPDILLNIGTVTLPQVTDIVRDLHKTVRVAFNIELAKEEIKKEH